jgi:hypothetical protein
VKPERMRRFAKGGFGVVGPMLAPQSASTPAMVGVTLAGRTAFPSTLKEKHWRRNQWRNKKREVDGGPIVHDVSTDSQFDAVNKAMTSQEYADYVPESKFPMVIESGKVEYGDDTYTLYRSLYKELAEEMRREIFSRPPAPLDYWQVLHAPNTRFVTFVREEGMAHNARAVMYTDLDIRDSPQMNPTIAMADWLPIDAFIIRGKIVMHFAAAAIDNSLHIRNVRCYRDKDGILATADLGMSYIRDHLRYDGPAIIHMEQDVQTELWDIFHDYGFDESLFRWVSHWTYYHEHVEYVRWLRNFLHLVLPNSVREETELLSREERVELDAASGEFFAECSAYIPVPPEWPEEEDKRPKKLEEGTAAAEDASPAEDEEESAEKPSGEDSPKTGDSETTRK